jgi:hypothetical protein
MFAHLETQQHNNGSMNRLCQQWLLTKLTKCTHSIHVWWDVYQTSHHVQMFGTSVNQTSSGSSVRKAQQSWQQ